MLGLRHLYGLLTWLPCRTGENCSCVSFLRKETVGSFRIGEVVALEVIVNPPRRKCLRAERLPHGQSREVLAILRLLAPDEDSLGLRSVRLYVRIHFEERQKRQVFQGYYGKRTWVRFPSPAPVSF